MSRILSKVLHDYLGNRNSIDLAELSEIWPDIQVEIISSLDERQFEEAVGGPEQLAKEARQAKRVIDAALNAYLVQTYEQALRRALEEAHVRGGEDALSCVQCHTILGIADEALAALSKPPPPDPLLGLLAELEQRARNAQDRVDLGVWHEYYEQDNPGSVKQANFSTKSALDLARRLRAAIGLPPKEASDG